MTEDQTKAREQAAHDLQDIEALRRSEPFNRYYLRRFKAKKEQVARKFRHDKCGHEQREIYRQQLEMYDEIERMLDNDEAMAALVIDNTQ